MEVKLQVHFTRVVYYIERSSGYNFHWSSYVLLYNCGSTSISDLGPLATHNELGKCKCMR